MTAWNTMDTAPKNGRAVLLAVRWIDEPVIATWHNSRWIPTDNCLRAEGGWDGAILVSDLCQADILWWTPISAMPNTMITEFGITEQTPNVL